ncbi:phospholipase effector Tle1 domain-containing protein, partial [Photobacterium sp. R1]
TGIEFDVFGFSRGAALTRHFVNAVHAGLPDYTKPRIGCDSLTIHPNLLGSENAEKFDRENGYELDNSRDVTIRFVGLFDTVGSFYWPGNDDDGEFQLRLTPDCAQRVVQLCAHHEYRVNFPLTTLKSNGT